MDTETCAHENFHAHADVNRLTKNDQDPTVVGYSLELRVECSVCHEPFVFIGAPVGLMPTKPCINVDGTELRVPCRPQSADPHFGMGLAGFEARVRQGLPESEN